MTRKGSSALCLVNALLFASPAAAAPPVLYHSPADDGVNAGVPVVVPGGASVTLHLYVDGGSVASPAGQECYTGPSDELCGWDFALVGTGSASFSGFTPAGDVEYNLGSTTLRCNGGNPFVGTLGPSKIGDLVLSGAQGDSVDLVRGDVVTSQLTLTQVALGPLVTVPEPGLVSGLLCGAALLGWLVRHGRGGEVVNAFPRRSERD